MNTIDISLAKKLSKYGENDFYACYNCGNCTAVCGLTDEDSVFPRRMIRWGMLGMKDKILASKELWLCYACGECTETCPREANPGNFMAQMRRYAIAQYEPSGITRLLFKNNGFAILFTLVLATILGFFLLTSDPEHRVSRWLFNWLPYEIIHNLGLIIFGFTGLMVAVGVFRMAKNIHSTMKMLDTKTKFISSVMRVIGELFTMKRYQKCEDTEEEDAYWHGKSFLVKPWFVHWSIMWGFIGLLIATTLNFAFKDPATDIWLPTRLLGTVTGVLMMYGATLALWFRIKKVNKNYSSSTMADWWLLIFLWIAGFTGFWLVAVVTFQGAESNIHHIMFLIHTVVSMELVVLFAFSKFAHAIYRPLALYMHFRKTSN